MTPTRPENAPDRRTDPEVRERWDRLAAHYEQLAKRYDRLHRVWARVVIGLVVGVAVLTAGVALALVRLGQTTAAIERTTSRIDAERYRNVRDGCESQNDRNRATKAALPENGNLERLRLTIALIDALAPYRENCEALARTQVGGGE